MVLKLVFFVNRLAINYNMRCIEIDEEVMEFAEFIDKLQHEMY